MWPKTGGSIVYFLCNICFSHSARDFSDNKLELAVLVDLSPPPPSFPQKSSWMFLEPLWSQFLHFWHDVLHRNSLMSNINMPIIWMILTRELYIFLIRRLYYHIHTQRVPPYDFLSDQICLSLLYLPQIFYCRRFKHSIDLIVQK